ncbi:MAG TPA: von Willebrand factor type A domain-containing protein, partial [Chitinophagaceae bacterium]|nr:von Willebrand factor type A domain-containing protein [Chitinophagaceae bacterium]
SPLVSQAPGKQLQDSHGYFYQREQKYEEFNTEDYDHISENKFLKVKDNPLSTFSINVDAASYSNVRRFLNQGQLPPEGAVRIEEMINYFHYEYPQPRNNDPFSIMTEISDAPWNKDHKLVLIGLQGKKIPTENLPASNLVFLIDVSGSMDAPNKLSLVKSSMKMLVDQLREEDNVAIVVYAGAAGLVLKPTSGAEKT